MAVIESEPEPESKAKDELSAADLDPKYRTDLLFSREEFGILKLSEGGEKNKRKLVQHFEKSMADLMEGLGLGNAHYRLVVVGSFANPYFQGQKNDVDLTLYLHVPPDRTHFYFEKIKACFKKDVRVANKGYRSWGEASVVNTSATVPVGHIGFLTNWRIGVDFRCVYAPSMALKDTIYQTIVGTRVTASAVAYDVREACLYSLGDPRILDLIAKQPDQDDIAFALSWHCRTVCSGHLMMETDFFSQEIKRWVLTGDLSMRREILSTLIRDHYYSMQESMHIYLVSSGLLDLIDPRLRDVNISLWLSAEVLKNRNRHEYSNVYLCRLACELLNMGLSSVDIEAKFRRVLMETPVLLTFLDAFAGRRPARRSWAKKIHSACKSMMALDQEKPVLTSSVAFAFSALKLQAVAGNSGPFTLCAKDVQIPMQ